MNPILIEVVEVVEANREEAAEEMAEEATKIGR